VIRLAALALVVPCLLAAQETQVCRWESERQTVVQTTPGQRNTFFGGNVLMRCPAKGITLRSDSLESYQEEGRVFVIGRVRYSEPRLDVDSDFLTYFQRDERVIANGHVRARLPNGSTLVGPVAEYWRATPSTRPVPRLYATGRPTITLVQRDSAGAPAPPATVLANAVTMIGDSLVYAGGQVVVTREDVIARGDSMALDSHREITTLMRGPSIEGRRDRPFRLAGARIELTGGDRKLRRVLSMGTATATSEDLVLASDTIDLRVANDLLQRAMAWGPSRARASSAAQNIVSDSIDVFMPDQRIREMHAVRGALAQGRPDSTRFRADTLDWMRGDTIVARFDSATAPRDTSRAARDSAQARLRELHAQGNARSYYHLAPADSSQRRPAINYVSGREIVVDFQQQRVSKVTVVEQASGVYLEPRTENASDSTRAATAASPGRTAPARPSPVTRPPATRPVAPPVRRPR
jgi:hypothetical protein